MASIMRVRPMGPAAVEAAFDEIVRRGMAASGTWTPPADIVVDGADAVITLEIPGVDGADVEVKDSVLTIRGQRAGRAETGLVRSEIRRGEFSRSFRLPAHVTPDAVSASYTDGMLIVRVAGANPAPVSQRIEVAGLAPLSAEQPDPVEQSE